MPTSKKTSKKTKKKSSSPPRFDGSKYNYQGTKFGYKNKNKLKSEYKSAKQNTVKHKELMEWKQKQQTAFQMSNNPSEPQEPLTLEPVEPQEPQESVQLMDLPPPRPPSVEEQQMSYYDPNKFSFQGDALPDDVIEYYMQNYALDDGQITEETCKRIRQTCELFPKTCYLNREFLDKYIRRCQMIAKTGLYRQRIVDTPEIDVIGDPRRRLWRRDYHSMTPQSYFVQYGDWKTRWRNSRYGFPTTSYEIDRLLNQIPKTQMNENAKQAFLRVFDAMFEPLRIRDHMGQLVDQRRSYNHMVQRLKRNPDMLEQFIQNWRRELEREGLSPKNIEFTIRRFLKTFYE